MKYKPFQIPPSPDQDRNRTKVGQIGSKSNYPGCKPCLNPNNTQLKRITKVFLKLKWMHFKITHPKCHQWSTRHSLRTTASKDISCRNCLGHFRPKLRFLLHSTPNAASIRTLLTTNKTSPVQDISMRILKCFSIFRQTWKYDFTSFNQVIFQLVILFNFVISSSFAKALRSEFPRFLCVIDRTWIQNRGAQSHNYVWMSTFKRLDKTSYVFAAV